MGRGGGSGVPERCVSVKSRDWMRGVRIFDEVPAEPFVKFVFSIQLSLEGKFLASRSRPPLRSLFR
jgi:hypothetical protein